MSEKEHASIGEKKKQNEWIKHKRNSWKNKGKWKKSSILEISKHILYKLQNTKFLKNVQQ